MSAGAERIGRELTEARDAVRELIRLLERVQYVRLRLTGNAKAQAWDKLGREIDAAITRVEPQS